MRDGECVNRSNLPFILVRIRMEDSKRASGAYHGRHFKPGLRQTTPWLSLESPASENMEVALGFGIVGGLVAQEEHED